MAHLLFRAAWVCRFRMLDGEDFVMSETKPIEVGDLVQLSPETCRNPMFGGCILVVTELKSFGVQGYVQAFGKNEQIGGQAYYRAGFDEFEPCGKAVWVVP